jgi:hypothetical protein
MAQANREGTLPFLASGLALRPGPHLTPLQVAERLGVTVAQVAAFRLAFGLPPVAPDAAAFTEAEVKLFGAFAVGVGLFGEQAMRRTNRENRLTPVSNVGSSELVLAQAVLRAIETISAPAAMIQGLLPAHLELVGRRLRQGVRASRRRRRARAWGSSISSGSRPCRAGCRPGTSPR